MDFKRNSQKHYLIRSKRKNILFLTERGNAGELLCLRNSVKRNRQKSWLWMSEPFNHPGGLREKQKLGNNIFLNSNEENF